jgi:hypothetical protein
MVTLGGSGPFDMDEWCYYYTQATGLACPDPGAIPATVYSAAGLTDRTTPTYIGQWLQIMQPLITGLSGLGNGTTPVNSYATSAEVNSLLTAEGIQISGYDIPWWIVAAVVGAGIYFVAGDKK